MSATDEAADQHRTSPTSRRSSAVPPISRSSSPTVAAAAAAAAAAVTAAALFQRELLSVLECPVCFDYALPPIQQCRNGHIVCSQCRPRLHECPQCRDIESNWAIRNLALEKMARVATFPCRYSDVGCCATLSWSEKIEHESICFYRPISCPCPGAPCQWQGCSSQAVAQHLLSSAHPSVTALCGDDIVFLATDVFSERVTTNSSSPSPPPPFPAAIVGHHVNWVMIQRCYGHDFLLSLQKHQVNHTQIVTRVGATTTTPSSLPQPKFRFYCLVQLIGERGQMDDDDDDEDNEQSDLNTNPPPPPRFLYRLEFATHNAHRRHKRLIYESQVRNIFSGGGLEGAIADGDCLDFDDLFARKFAVAQLPDGRTATRNINAIANPISYNLPINVQILKPE